ncbi:MAG: tyrosine recombinase XerC [Planctomycetes bacterium]|nr:tyrosine recombinase XerC [Planctomycetota bacterium]
MAQSVVRSPATSTIPAPLSVTLAGAVERYLEFARHRGKSANTLRNYRTDLARLVEHLGAAGCIQLIDVDRPLLRAWLASLGKAGKAARTIRRQLSTTRGMFKWALAFDLIPTDPTGALRGPRLPRDLPGVLSVDQALALLKAPDSRFWQGKRDRAVLLLLYGAGLRAGEVSGLNVASVDFAGGALNIIGKGDRERRLPMLPAVARGVRAWLKTREAEGPALLLNKRGSRLTAHGIGTIVRKHAAAIGIVAHPHSLRHAFATHLMDGGAGLQDVQELLGHQSPETTQVYTHLSVQHLVRVYARAHPQARKDQP